MVIINVAEQGIAVQIRKKLGRPVEYGKKIYGKIKYGEEGVLIGYGQYGIKTYGIEKYGEVINPYGIYKVRGSKITKGQYGRGIYGIIDYGDLRLIGKQIIIKQKFYIPAEPGTPAQQANWQKYTNAILSWQGLTDDQKQVYNKRAKYKPYSGYNLYIKKYLLSN